MQFPVSKLVDSLSYGFSGVMGWVKRSSTVHGKLVNPFYAFCKSLATFMAAVVVYKGKLEKEVPPVKCCSLKVLTKKVKAFLEAEHEELVHIWERYI